MASMLRARWLITIGAAAAALAFAGSAGAHPGGHHNGGHRGGNGFTVQNLVSDQSGMATHMDPNLVNAWGLGASAGSPWWVADNGQSVSTVYDGSGNPFPPPPASPLVVGVPNDPTGLVASTDSAFPIGTGASAGPAKFIFDTEEGKVLAWHGGFTAAQVAVDASSGGAIFKGLAIANDRLYATDFHNGRVDVYDANFQPVTLPAGAFTDPMVPSGFAPFGIQAIGSTIYVTFAKQDATAHDDVKGHGLGVVDAFDLNGVLTAHVASGGTLNAPWGLALAPAGFGRFGGDLLVGNFGNGKIHAFKLAGNSGNWAPDGHLKMAGGGPIAIDGLWALEFGLGGTNNGPTTTLFFTAGPNDEGDGLFGSIISS